ncbi:hypothetical protein EON67_03815 [archaeon]|nr:MAG: hypothetical protein EON67_03815 [archaeon]
MSACPPARACHAAALHPSPPRFHVCACLPARVQRIDCLPRDLKNVLLVDTNPVTAHIFVRA